ncbi:MAG: hypothetical protein H3C54_07555 [Taibaiella sp.]|nr:hypothetical protein [Taibaiella sp.]
MHRIIIILAATCLLYSCNSKTNEPSKLDKMAWILGYWEMVSPEGKVTESWIRTNDSVYSGIGKYTDTAGQTLTTEEISIVLRGDKLLYIPLVSNQNDGQPVIFSEVDFSNTMVVFENINHEFPQRIVYVKQGDGKMLAYIEGEMNGEPARLEYPYTKH